MGKYDKELTPAEIKTIDKIIHESGYTKIITKWAQSKIEAELGLNRYQVKRRATQTGLSYTFGAAFEEISDDDAGKMAVVLICKTCKCEYTTNILAIRNRKYPDREYCGKHYVGAVTKTKTWRNKNSKSQKIAQNRPEVLEKQRRSQQRRFESPALRQKYAMIGKKLWEDKSYQCAVSKALREKWKDRSYAEKIFASSKRAYTGEYKGIRYESCAELAFLLYCEQLKWQVRRYNEEGIAWVDEKGITRSYYPDFIVNDFYIIEVKASDKYFSLAFNRKQHVLAKFGALQNFCKNSKFECALVFITKEVSKKLRVRAKETAIGQAN